MDLFIASLQNNLPPSYIFKRMSLRCLKKISVNFPRIIHESIESFECLFENIHLCLQTLLLLQYLKKYYLNYRKKLDLPEAPFTATQYFHFVLLSHHKIDIAAMNFQGQKG